MISALLCVSVSLHGGYSLSLPSDHEGRNMAWKLRKKPTGIPKTPSIPKIKPVKPIKPIEPIRSTKPVAPIGKEYYWKSDKKK